MSLLSRTIHVHNKSQVGDDSMNIVIFTSYLHFVVEHCMFEITPNCYSALQGPSLSLHLGEVFSPVPNGIFCNKR
jgi:hypothetical protein